MLERWDDRLAFHAEAYAMGTDCPCFVYENPARVPVLRPIPPWTFDKGLIPIIHRTYRQVCALAC